VLNPGSPTERRGGRFHSMLVLRIEGGKIEPELVNLSA
jgi:predicted phosphodiesterase